MSENAKRNAPPYRAFFRFKERRTMSNANSFQKNQYVKWSWANGTAKGQIAERFEREVTRTLKGSEITRKGDADNPAYLITQDHGDQVLKLGSELQADPQDG
ncbi:DUF2945 domain-containing protein [Pacificimonas sp. ICDLI1SI03]